VKGKSVALGSYDTPEEASKVYEAAVIHYRVQGYKYEAGSFLRAIKEDASTPESAQPGHAETLAMMPQSELQAVPAAVRERPLIVPPGCCPNCASPLYRVVGSSDDAKKCQQCGFQTPRAKIDAHGRRVLNSNGEEEAFCVAGISRRQLEDQYWMDLHVGKGRGVLA
jgi:hypothetical protein